MAKHKLKLHYTFIGKDRKPLEGTIFDDSHPMFESQKWKFEPLQTEEQMVAEQEVVPTNYSHYNRSELIELWKKLGGEEPAEDITNSQLRDGIATFIKQAGGG